MSDFKVTVLKLVVENHPDPETTSLEVGKVGDYNIVTAKGLYKTGDLVAYIPEQSIVPEEIIKEVGLEGRLAGSAKNRVKAMKLRGVVSQGLIYRAREGWVEGQDVADELGITKYVPPIPTALVGEVQSHPSIRYRFDVENIKQFPNEFMENEVVTVTEKLHGTCGLFCLTLDGNEFHQDAVGMDLFVSSKGLMAKGIYLKNNEVNKNNVYLRTALKYDIREKLIKISKENIVSDQIKRIWLLGEIYGVQKGFNYDCNGDIGFRAFALYLDDGNQKMATGYFDSMCKVYDIPKVPVLYTGPYSKQKIKELTDGDAFAGKHIREGVVITSFPERPYINGRLILKSVSDKYLLKSTGEEFA